MSEPRLTALLLLVIGTLLTAAVLVSRLSARSGFPAFLLFVALGAAIGEDGLGLKFDDYALAFRVGSVALTLILFDGGLETPLRTFRHYVAPGLSLATAGVVITTLLVAVAAHFTGFAWLDAFLLGAIVSSTDAAAVFSVLRGGGVALRERVGATLEVESGLNDPMAVLLTVALTEAVLTRHVPGLAAFAMVLVDLVVGAVVGIAMGHATRFLLAKIRLPVASLYPILTIGMALATSGLATILHGSGFLAVYVCGMVIASAGLPYASALARVHDFMAWLGQVIVFLVLGLLVAPSRVLGVAGAGLAVGLFLAFVARPVAVAAALAPFRYRPREVVYVGWVGLRGAVPIVLACIPVLAGVKNGVRIFDVVFFAVAVSATLQGTTVRWLTKKLRLGRGDVVPPPAVLEILATRPLGHELLVFEIREASAVFEATVADVPFPEGAAAMLLARGDELLAPRGPTVLSGGDIVYVFCKKEDRPEIELLFGAPRD